MVVSDSLGGGIGHVVLSDSTGLPVSIPDTLDMSRLGSFLLGMARYRGKRFRIWHLPAWMLCAPKGRPNLGLAELVIRFLANARLKALVWVGGVDSDKGEYRCPPKVARRRYLRKPKVRIPTSLGLL